MGKILVPVDFSDHSAYALEVAASLARHSGAEIVLLHMMGLSEAILTKDSAQEAAEAHYYMKLTHKRFQEFRDKPYLEGLKVHEMVQNYKIFSEVNEVAMDVKASLNFAVDSCAYSKVAVAPQSSAIHTRDSNG